MIHIKMVPLQSLRSVYSRLTRETTKKPLGRWFNVKDHPNYIDDILQFKDDRKKRYSEKIRKMTRQENSQAFQDS